MDIDVAVDKFKNAGADSLHRYKSWEFCYDYFRRNLYTDRFDVDYGALILSEYLSSWGMRRGGSALLTEYNYRIHSELLLFFAGSTNYGRLYVAPDKGNTNAYIADTVSAGVRVKEYYNHTKVSPTDTLITKILLGVFGCTPAFDRFAKKAMREHKELTSNFNDTALVKCWEFYFKNEESFQRIATGSGFSYPPMKLLDMALFTLGGIDEEEI